MSGNYSTYGSDLCPRGSKAMLRQPSVKSNDPVHNDYLRQQLILPCLALDSDHRLSDAKQGNGKQRLLIPPSRAIVRTFFSGAVPSPLQLPEKIGPCHNLSISADLQLVVNIQKEL